MRISEWQWDDGNLDELAWHGVRPSTVEAVAEERPRFRRNKKGRAASHQMIGPDKSGAIYVICIVAIPGRPGLWRAVTGWPADDAERDWYAKRDGSGI